MNKRVCVVLSSIMLSALPAFSSGVPSALSAQLQASTGASNTRIVWLRGSTDTRTWHSAAFFGGAVMAYDSKTGSTRSIVAANTNNEFPMLYKGGTQVIYTQSGKIYSIDFEGKTGMRYLVSGRRCADVWRDPATGIDWMVIERDTDISLFQVDPFKLLRRYRDAVIPVNRLNCALKCCGEENPRSIEIRVIEASGSLSNSCAFLTRATIRYLSGENRCIH